jgi:hypothetical protein
VFQDERPAKKVNKGPSSAPQLSLSLATSVALKVSDGKAWHSEYTPTPPADSADSGCLLHFTQEDKCQQLKR